MLNKTIHKNTVFAWIACGIAVTLAVPLLTMQSTNAVNWSLFDFIVAGALLFVFASALVFVARRSPKKQLLLASVAIGVLAVYVWAELAVGIFFGFGS